MQHSFSLPKIRHKPFKGATRYAYYKKKDSMQPTYIYSCKNPAEYIWHKSNLLFLFYYTPFIILIAIFISTIIINKPQKITGDYDTNITIQDYTATLTDNDMALLNNSFTNFYSKTGIPTALIIINNSTWQNDYKSLKDFSYDLYNNIWPDSNHLLITYSESTEEDDYYWSYIKGNKTDVLLTKELMTVFNTDLKRYLADKTNYNTATAIEKALSNLSTTAMQTHINTSLLPLLLICILCIIIHAGVTIDLLSLIISRKYKNIIKIPDIVKEFKCPHCDCVCIENITTVCPHCGKFVINRNKISNKTRTIIFKNINNGDVKASTGIIK